MLCAYSTIVLALYYKTNGGGGGGWRASLHSPSAAPNSVNFHHILVQGYQNVGRSYFVVQAIKVAIPLSPYVTIKRIKRSYWYQDTQIC